MNDVYPNFKKIAILDQKILDESKQLKRLLGFVRNEKTKDEIEKLWNSV